MSLSRAMILAPIVCSLAVSGCALSSDLLPAFDGPLAFGGLTKYVDIVDLEHEVQCEISSFLSDKYTYTDSLNHEVSVDISNHLLAFDQPATVTLSVQTDLSGKATATGINLSKIGLNPISNIITLANKVPTLQANLQAKNTVLASPVSVIPQTKQDIWSVYIYKIDKNGKKTGPVAQNLQMPSGDTTFAMVRKTIQDRIKSGIYEGISLAKDGEPLPATPTDPSPKVKQPTGPIIKGLGRVTGCPAEGGRLFVKEWLSDFFTRNMAPQYDEKTKMPIPGGYYLRRTAGDLYNSPLISVACDSKLTLKTAIAITFDASAGVNPILSTTYLIPISAFSLDFSPAWTQTLQIDFALENSENNNLCEKLLARKPLGS